MTEQSFTTGQTIILITRTGTERVVFLGQNYDGTDIIIGRAGTTETDTVSADNVMSTEEWALRNATDAYASAKRFRNNRTAWRNASIKAMKLEAEYAAIAGLTPTEAIKNIQNEYESSEAYR